MRKVGRSLTKLVCTGFPWLQLPISGGKSISFGLVLGRHLSHVSLYPVFRKKRRVRVPFLYLLFFKCI